jgi:ankyrin repeat protein
VSYNHAELVQFLLQHGADVNLRDQDGNTALHFCESVEFAKHLVEHGADIMAVNSEGHAAVQDAFEESYLEVVQYLMGLGCPAPVPPEAGDSDADDGEGPLDEAEEDN